MMTRRELLQQVGGATAASVVGRPALIDPPPPPNPNRTAVVHPTIGFVQRVS